MEVEAPKQRLSPSSSPEFEFWMVRNPSFPPSNLLTADELFLDGVLLPLQLLSLPSSDHRPAQPPSPSPTAPPAEPSPSPSPSPSSILFSSSSTSSSLSRRWKDLFKAAPEKKPAEKDLQEKNLRKKDHRRSSPDLNINLNIWPFTRSRSAGGRPRSTGSVSVSGRKVSSAPCSRSNSGGESAVGRRWAASPGRGGVHLARPTPVWQIRRAGMGPKEKSRMWAQATSSSSAAGARVLNLNVNSCIGYGEKVSARGNDSDGITGGDRIVVGSGANGRETSVFSLRAIFSKKVY